MKTGRCLHSIGLFILLLSCQQENLWESANDQADTAAPQAVTVEATTNTTVALTFDESLEQASAETIGNYTISGGGSNLGVTNAAIDASNPARVLLTTAAQSETSYTVTVQGIEDLKGNALTTAANYNFAGDLLPTLTSTGVSATFNAGLTRYEATFTFSEPVTGSEVIGNYGVTRNDTSAVLAISSVEVSDETVTLVTATQNPIAYTLAISGITDNHGNAITGGYTIEFPGVEAFDFSMTTVTHDTGGNDLIDITMTHSPDAGSSTTAANYTLSDGVTNTNPNLVANTGGNNFRLTFPDTAITHLTNYTLTIENVTIPSSSLVMDDTHKSESFQADTTAPNGFVAVP